MISLLSWPIFSNMADCYLSLGILNFSKPNSNNKSILSRSKGVGKNSIFSKIF